MTGATEKLQTKPILSGCHLAADCFNCPFPDCILSELYVCNPKAKVSEYSRRHREKTKGNYLEYQRAYYQAHRERLLAVQRVRRAAKRQTEVK